MDRIAVSIPCYNESATVAKVVSDFRQALPEATVYVYDNKSTDDTGALALAAGAIVRHEPLQGKGNVVRRMFSEIDAQCYILVDGDDTYPADAAEEMADLVLTQQADMVIGDRLSSGYFEVNKRPFHNLGNALVSQSINTLFGCDIKDIMTGYRAFSYRFVKTFPVLTKGFEIETEMSIHAVDKNLVVKNTVVAYRNRPTGSVSKLNTWSDGFKVLVTIFRLYRNYCPAVFFNILATVLFIVSIAFLLPIIVTYLNTGLVPRFPTLIVCMFVMIAAIQAFFSGQIMQMIYMKSRQDFELRLMRVMETERTLINIKD